MPTTKKSPKKSLKAKTPEPELVKHIIIPTDETIIYRGYSNYSIKTIKHVKEDINENKGRFFSDVKEDADKYGECCATYSFKVKKTLTFIKFPESINWVYNEAKKQNNSEVMKKLEISYGANKTPMYRNSFSSENDGIVGKFCSKLGYDGYYIAQRSFQVPPVFDRETSYAEAEMYIHKPKDKIVVNDKMNKGVNDNRVPKCPSKKRKTSAFCYSDENNISTNIFGFIPSSGNNLFGNTTPPSSPSSNKISTINAYSTPGGFRGGYVIRPSKTIKKGSNQNSKYRTLNKTIKNKSSKTSSRKSSRNTKNIK